MQPAPTNADEKAVYDFISALQASDFKGVVGLTAAYRSELDSIKQRNPEMLWPQLTNNYYQQKTAALSAPVDRLDPGEHFSWDSYVGILQGRTGDPDLDIRLARAMLPPSSQWQITEWRPHGRRDDIRFGLRNYGDVYVTVTYPSLKDAPQLHEKFLKRVILDYSVDADRHFVLDVTRMEAGDTFWPPDQVGRFYFDRTREILAVNETDLKAATNSLDAAVANDPSLSNTAGSVVWDALKPRTGDLRSLGKDRFLSLFSLCEKYGVLAEERKKPEYEFAEGLALYERGSTEAALPLLHAVTLADPTSPEAKVASEILAPVTIGRLVIHEPTFRFTNACYGGYRPSALDFDITLQYVDIRPTDILLGFRVRNSGAQPQVLKFAQKVKGDWPGYTNQPGVNRCHILMECLYIVDNPGEKLYSTGGFIGGRSTKQEYSPGVWKISFASGEDANITASFPKVRSESASFKFVSPAFGPGNQCEWEWDVKLKPDPFD